MLFYPMAIAHLPWTLSTFNTDLKHSTFVLCIVSNQIVDQNIASRLPLESTVTINIDSLGMFSAPFVTHSHAENIQEVVVGYFYWNPRRKCTRTNPNWIARNKEEYLLQSEGLPLHIIDKDFEYYQNHLAVLLQRPVQLYYLHNGVQEPDKISPEFSESHWLQCWKVFYGRPASGDIRTNLSWRILQVNALQLFYLLP